MSPIHKFSEVFHPAFSVRILEEHSTHILSTKVHLMGQLQYSIHPDVATNYKRPPLIINCSLYTYILYINIVS